MTMTGLIFKIKGIEDALSVEFYIERERSIKMDKDDLVKLSAENGEHEFYVTLDTSRLGRGHLMARVEFEDRGIMYPGGTRPVVVSGWTGYSIPGMGNGNVIKDEEHEVSFIRVNRIPAAFGSTAYMGVLKRSILSFAEITEEDVLALERTGAGGTASYNVEAGDKLLVVIPRISDCKGYKGDGFGGMIPFSTSVMGENGTEMNIGGVKHKIYGEMIIVNGIIKLYVV